MKKKFSDNKRAYYSSIILSFIAFMTLFAEIIANDKPLLIIDDKKVFFPVFFNYSEQDFGGELLLEADYKDDIFIEDYIDGLVVWPIIRYSYNTINEDMLLNFPSAISKDNWLGTDDQGRDVLARIIYGTRISLLFGFLLTFFSSIIGIFIGAIQGYYGGKLDIFLQRFIEIWGGLPTLFIIIILSSIFDSSFMMLLIIMIFFQWHALVPLIRAEFLKTRNLYYVKYAQVIGLSEFRIMFKHVLPNSISSTLSVMPFIATSSITALTSLDFLGFGLPLEYASLGELLVQGKNNIHEPRLVIVGFFSVSIILVCMVFIGEGVRDLFDPRK